MTIQEKAIVEHKKWRGKIEVASTVAIETMEDMSTAYTPGVAEPCKEIHQDVAKVYDYTRKWNLVAIVSDGTAVLGLGDIGPEAAMPVMEGKAVLFKTFAGVDAFPICIGTKDTEEIIKTVKYLEPTFGGINLEDISAPRCFEIERRLKEEMNIPVFHDDQHGTAIVVLAALTNALRLVGKKMDEITAVINGAGSAGISIARLLMKSGLKNVIMCDKNGAIYEGCEGLTSEQEIMAKVSNLDKRKGTLKDVLVGADVFIGVSAPNMVDTQMVKTMAGDAIVFAMANPTPEIFPADALAGGARVVGTGRSDFANQINNVLAFPGIFRGALDVRASEINDEMKLAAAVAIASIVTDEELCAEYIIPSPLNKKVAASVCEAVKIAAIETGVARV